MVDIRLMGGVTPTRSTKDNDKISAQGTRDGGLVTAEYLLARAIEGRTYAASIGTSTPTSFAKTAFDADQPQLVVDVPNGTAIVPVKLSFALQDSAGTDTNVAVMASTVNVGAGTSTAITPVNKHFGSSLTSSCSVYSLYTANGTDPATGTELWMDRWVYAFADATTDPVKKHDFDLLSEGVVIEGTGSLVVYVFGTTTAPAGYMSLTWIELPSTMVSG